MHPSPMGLPSLSVEALPALGWVARDECDLTLMGRVQNMYAVKPMGGLWVSPQLGGTATVWSNWLEREGFGLVEGEEAFLYQAVVLKPEARVLCIDSWDDFARILSAYLLLHEDFSKYNLNSQFLDFERMSEDWDAIYLTDEGQWATRFTKVAPGKLDGPCLYGWDLESVLILNAEAIAEVGAPHPLTVRGASLAWDDELEDELT